MPTPKIATDLICIMLVLFFSVHASAITCTENCGEYGCDEGLGICFGTPSEAGMPSYTNANITCPGAFSLIRVTDDGAETMRVDGCDNKCKKIAYKQRTCEVVSGETTLQSSNYAVVEGTGPEDAAFTKYADKRIICAANIEDEKIREIFINDTLFNTRRIAGGYRTVGSDTVSTVWLLDTAYSTFPPTYSGNVKDYFVVKDANYTKCVDDKLKGDAFYEKYKGWYGGLVTAYIYCSKVKYFAPRTECRDMMIDWYMRLNETQRITTPLTQFWPLYPGSTDEANLKRWNALVDVNEAPANNAAVGYMSSSSPRGMFRDAWNKIFMVSPSLDDIRNNILWTKSGPGSFYAGGGFQRRDKCELGCQANRPNNILDGCTASLSQTSPDACKCSSEQHDPPVSPYNQDINHCTNDSNDNCKNTPDRGDCDEVCRIEFEYDEKGVLGTTMFVLDNILPLSPGLSVAGSGNIWVISNPAFTMTETGNMNFTITDALLTNTSTPQGVNYTITRRYNPSSSDKNKKFTVASDIVFNYNLETAGIFEVKAWHTYSSSGTQKMYKAACNRKVCEPAHCDADTSLVRCCMSNDDGEPTYCWCQWGGCNVDGSGNIITTVPPTYKLVSLKQSQGGGASCMGSVQIYGLFKAGIIPSVNDIDDFQVNANIFVSGHMYPNSTGLPAPLDLPCGSYTLAIYNPAYQTKTISFEILDSTQTNVSGDVCKMGPCSSRYGCMWSFPCIQLVPQPTCPPAPFCVQEEIGRARSACNIGSAPAQIYECCGDWGCASGRCGPDHRCYGGTVADPCGGRLIEETSTCGIIETMDEEAKFVTSCSVGPVTSEAFIEKIDTETFKDSVTVPDYWFANVSRPRPDMDSGLPHAKIRINGTIDRCLGPDSDEAAGNLDITMDPDLLVTFELHIGNYTFKPPEDVPIFAEMPVEHILYPKQTANRLLNYTFDDWYGYQQQEFNYPAQCNTLCPSNCMCAGDIRLPVCEDADGRIYNRTDCVCRADATLRDTCLSERSMHDYDFENIHYDFAKTRTFENPYEDWQAAESHINHTYSYSFEGLGPTRGDLISNVTYGTLAGLNESDYIISEEDVQKANITIYTFYENITIDLFPNTVNGASPRYAGDSNIVVEVFPRNGSKMKITSVYPGEFFLSPNTDMSLTGTLYDACNGMVLPSKTVKFNASDKGIQLPAAATTNSMGAAAFAFRIGNESTTATITFEGDNTHTESKDSIYLGIWTFSSFWFLLSPDVLLLIIIFIVGLLSYRFFRKGRIDFGGMWRQLRGED